MKKKARHNKKNNKLKIIILLSLLIIFICGISYIIYYFYNSNKEKHVNENILNEIDIDTTQITDTKTERMLQIEELQKENQEIIGWLEIEDTNINYPICQTNNNDFYLTHNYKQ